MKYIPLLNRRHIYMARPVKTATSPDYRVEICMVAQTLCAERGFGGTTIREIADQTGENSVLLYHYFTQQRRALAVGPESSRQ